MQFLLLIYEEESAAAKLSEAQMEQLMGEYFSFTEKLKTDGHFVGGNALDPVSTATTVRVNNGKKSLTDGPFAETKEQLGGYYLVEAEDLDQACDIAARIPAARTGCVEVRPVMVFD